MWSTSKKNWADAEEFCVNEGGHLASVTSDAIKEYVVEGMNIKGLNKTWIGGTDKQEEDVWKWTDNRPWEFTSWAPREPNNAHGNSEHCLEMVLGWGWNDVGCRRHELRFLCSKKTQSGNKYQFCHDALVYRLVLVTFKDLPAERVQPVPKYCRYFSVQCSGVLWSTLRC